MSQAARQMALDYQFAASTVLMVAKESRSLHGILWGRRAISPLISSWEDYAKFSTERHNLTQFLRDLADAIDKPEQEDIFQNN